MKPFEYAAPESLADVLGLLGSSWGETEIYAGGTDLVTCLKQGLTAPNRVVSLRNVAALQGVTADEKGVTIGAMTPLKSLAASTEVKQYFPAVVSAVRGIGCEQMIAAGTIGGDLCQRPRCWYYRTGHGLFGEEDGKSLVEAGDNRYHAIFGNSGKAKFVSASSLGPVLIALDATALIEGPTGKRTVPVADFFRTPESGDERETALAPNEVLTGVTLPSTTTKNACYEIRHRHGLDWPYVSAAVVLAEGGAKVVLGHVAPTPLDRPEAAAALSGGALDEAAATKAGELAAEGATPLSGNAYKVQMVKVAVKRAALAAAAAG